MGPGGEGPSRSPPPRFLQPWLFSVDGVTAVPLTECIIELTSCKTILDPGFKGTTL